ncbi:hypothetical protein [Curtobacterium sp. MCBA15_013]|uniref:hypothetical protein n=1 Tax=Curtobacterium sp. MCBA15_013 TaxID=1898739 RepID=UPI000A9EDEDD|nr:hypothetical protein [Curtobacterium sp. MCBA15_013]
MTSIALQLDHHKTPDADLVLPWFGDAADAFKTRLTPDLHALGTPLLLNADFVRIAVAVWGADRLVLRTPGGTGWGERALDVRVPVSEPAAWSSVATDLERALNFLTGDRWTVQFEDCEPTAVEMDLVTSDAARVVLVSGGADSACGALLASDEPFTVVSHTSNPATSLAQDELYPRIRTLAGPNLIATHQVSFQPRMKAVGVTRTEPSNRSRSLLFLAMGLAVGSRESVPLWIPENGFASLNPPLAGERLGALSTRTTQPWFLSEIARILDTVGGHAQIENPFQLSTKGEMFRVVKSRLGADGASVFLSATNSCSRTGQNFIGEQPGTHCGLCFGCLVRRASFVAADVDDRTRYLSNDPAQRRWAKTKSSWNALVDFVSIGVDDADLMLMPLPEGFTQAQAGDLCDRGVQELKMLVE